MSSLRGDNQEIHNDNQISENTCQLACKKIKLTRLTIHVQGRFTAKRIMGKVRSEDISHTNYWVYGSAVGVNILLTTPQTQIVLFLFFK